MSIRCAWCDLSLGSKAPFEDTRGSHGICPHCAAEMLKSHNDNLHSWQTGIPFQKESPAPSWPVTE